MLSSSRQVFARRFRGERATFAWLAVVLVGVGLVVAVPFFPGQINSDGIGTVTHAREGGITDQGTAAGSFMLRAWLKLGLGLSLTYLVELALVIAGMFLLLRHRLAPRWAALATVVVLFWPPTFAQLALLSRDSFFLGFTLLALAALAWAFEAERGTAAARNRVLIALALAIGAFLLRQNGICVVVAISAVGIPLLFGDEQTLIRGRRPSRRGSVVAGYVLALTVGLLIITPIGYRIAGVKAVHPENVAFVYDLAAISKDTGENQFSSEFVRRPRLWKEPLYSQPSLEKRFDWVNVITIFPPISKGLVNPNAVTVPDADTADLRRMWIDTVTSRPLDYLNARVRVNASSLGFTRRPLDAYPFEKGVYPYGPWGDFAQFNFAAPSKYPQANARALDMMGVFVGPGATIPLDIVWPLLVLGLAAGIMLLRRPGPKGPIVAVLLVQWLNIAVLFLATMASSYRYVGIAVPLSMVLAAWLIGDLLRARRTRV